MTKWTFCFDALVFWLHGCGAAGFRITMPVPFPPLRGHLESAKFPVTITDRNGQLWGPGSGKYTILGGTSLCWSLANDLPCSTTWRRYRQVCSRYFVSFQISPLSSEKKKNIDREKTFIFHDLPILLHKIASTQATEKLVKIFPHPLIFVVTKISFYQLLFSEIETYLHIKYNNQLIYWSNNCNTWVPD